MVEIQKQKELKVLGHQPFPIIGRILNILNFAGDSIGAVTK